MKRREFVKAASGLLVPALWGSGARIVQAQGMGPGPGVKAYAAGTPPTVTWQGESVGVLGTGTEWTFTNMAIGAADTGAVVRRVIFVGYCRDIGAGNTFTGATIGGIAATIHVQAGQGDIERAIICSALVPTGTTATVVISGAAPTALRGTVYTLDNALCNSGTPVTGSAGTAGAASVAPNLTASADGCLVGVTGWFDGSAKGTPTVTGFTIDVNDNTERVYFSKNALSGGSTTATTAWTGSFSAISAIAQWR